MLLMLEDALKVLKIITDSGYEAYIIGGFVRDYLLNIKSSDIDIATSATPKEIKEIFKDSSISNDIYGSLYIVKNNIRYEITTFRKEYDYKDNRHPSKIEYVSNIEEDIKRRDFTINTICIDKNGNVIDLINGRKDLLNRLIRCVGNSSKKIEEDALRILRAVRFATILNFDLDKDLIDAIKKHKLLLKKISYNRKKEELDKIFSSSNAKKGIKLLLDLELDNELELYKLKDVNFYNDLIGIWYILDVEDKYPFTSNEKDLLNNISKVIDEDNTDPVILYKYGLYINVVASELKGNDSKIVNKLYTKLKIHTRSDLDIDTKDILTILNKKPGEYLSNIYKNIEEEVLYSKIKNNRKDIIKYLKKNFMGD